MASNTKPDLKEIAGNIFLSTFDTIIHRTFLDEHRAHKLMLASLDPTTKLLHCERCKLPRLLDPPLAAKVRGAISDPPSNTQYCDLKPWSRRAGHDIYDNPFPKADATGRPPTKREREAAKAKQAAGGGGTPASDEANQGTGPPSPSENGEKEQDRKVERGEKKANKIDERLKRGEYIPWHTCPSCKRSLLITRFAKHLEQCMGLSGRAAGRAAMAKIHGSTPQASRAGTPAPGGSQEGSASKEKGDEEGDEDFAVKGPGNMKKKLLKRSLGNKLKKDKGVTPASANAKLHKSLAARKRPPGGGGIDVPRASPAPSTSADQRDRDEMLLGGEGDEDPNVHVKKRQTLPRVGSITSVNSFASTAPAGATMERQESMDDSLVDDAGSQADD